MSEVEDGIQFGYWGQDEDEDKTQIDFSQRSDKADKQTFRLPELPNDTPFDFPPANDGVQKYRLRETPIVEGDEVTIAGTFERTFQRNGTVQIASEQPNDEGQLLFGRGGLDALKKHVRRKLALTVVWGLGLISGSIVFIISLFI